MKRSHTKGKAAFKIPQKPLSLDHQIRKSVPLKNPPPNLPIPPKPSPQLSSITGLPSKEDEYQLREKIGEGAFAEVRLARRKSDGESVVIKIYNKLKLYDKDRRKSVQQEIRILQKTDHSGIIRMLDSYETLKTINIVMELFSITSLRSYFRDKPKLSNEELKSIVAQIASTLSYLHENNIAHRDIKLENILIDKITLDTKLIDFGFAIEVQGVQSCPKLIGTPSYLPPEMIRHKDYDPFKADVWSLGILFYFLCSGYFPYRSIDSKSLQQKIVKGELEFPNAIHPGCEYLITKMLRHDKEERVDMQMVLSDTWITPVNLADQINLLKSKAENC